MSVGNVALFLVTLEELCGEDASCLVVRFLNFGCAASCVHGGQHGMQGPAFSKGEGSGQ